METRQQTIIQDAIDALNAFGGSLTRAEAATLLAFWARADEFGPGDRGRVLEHFPLDDSWNSGPGGPL